jgi:hypothetical protein
MAKKQTRRSISVSRTTYERLKAFCEANNISMSQLVETRVNDFLGESPAPVAITPRPVPMPTSTTPRSVPAIAPTPMPAKPTNETAGATAAVPAQRPSVPSAPVIPMTSAAARYAVEPPPPIIKPKQQDQNAPKPAEKRPDQIFTF